MDEAIPSFIAMVLIPISYSITQGIIYGFLSYTILKIAAGKRNEISIALIVIDVFSVLALMLS